MTETPQENTAENYPAAESLPVRQRAVVATDRPARYIKQLGSHMGRKLLDRHLVRFGERDELVVTFEAVPAS